MSGFFHRVSLLLLVLVFTTVPVFAQTSSEAKLSPPHIDAFPRMTTYLDVHDESGAFLHGLQPSDIRVLENGSPVPVLEFYETRPGVQVVLAVNPGDPFAIRNSQGVSRHDFVHDSLVNWAKSRRGSTIDDLSIMITDGLERSHFSDPIELIETLETYQFESSSAIVDLDLLFRALEVASDTAPQPGMERAVLFVTAPLEDDVSFSLQNLISRANQQGVHVSVWLVGSSSAFSTPQTDQLAELASQTGGGFYTFSGIETLPDIEQYLEPLRDIYHLAYESQITEGGTHNLQVEIQRANESIISSQVDFDFDLQPPEPVFLSPVVEIQRELPAGRRNILGDEFTPDELEPKEQSYEILIDFPDENVRPLKRTALFVDGDIVDENIEPPFESFTWDLRTYTTTGQHLLQVEATDKWGLEGYSIETLVDVEVNQPSPNLVGEFFNHWPVILGLFLLLSVAVIFLILILRGRIQPRFPRVPLGFRRGHPKTDADRQTPAEAEWDKGEVSGLRLSGWVNRLHWPKRRMAAKASVQLIPLSGVNDDGHILPIPIITEEVTFGRDPKQATFVLDNPSVEGLHARVTRDADGTYWLIDEGSVAGTWVNYRQITDKKITLEQDDLIHIGGVGFRFTQHEPQLTLKPVITLTEPQG
jgi:hypothetical protein